MLLNEDFNNRVIVHAQSLPWLESPIPGVRRRMLERLGNEVARATTIVEYAPGSVFSPHVHAGGEEFIVLDGVFSDEHGDYPAGSYIRNPPQSRHTPRSEDGCTIFVKLWQFDPQDRTHVRLPFSEMQSDADLARPGVRVTPLFDDEFESVRIEHWAPGVSSALACPEGLEVLVLEGEIVEGGHQLKPMSWLRIPAGGTFDAVASDSGALVWMKQGYLAHLHHFQKMASESGVMSV